MSMLYELWDVETGNQIGHYPTEEDALDAVRDTISRYGRHSDEVTSLGLLCHDPLLVGGGLIAESTALVDRALGAEQSSEHIIA